MIINKITVGFVIQRFDTETKKFESQEFICGDDVSFENEYGEHAYKIDEYLPYEMKQPKELKDLMEFVNVTSKVKGKSND